MSIWIESSSGLTTAQEAKIDVIDGNVDDIKIDARTQPQIVERTVAILPAGTVTPYFTVTGRVLITQIIGEVVGNCNGVATSIKLISNPSVGVDVDLCTAVVITSDVAGNIYTITGTLSDAMVSTVSGAVQAQLAPILVSAGTIDLDADATNAGTTKWTVHYIPLDADSTVVVA